MTCSNPAKKWPEESLNARTAIQLTSFALTKIHLQNSAQYRFLSISQAIHPFTNIQLKIQPGLDSPTKRKSGTRGVVGKVVMQDRAFSLRQPAPPTRLPAARPAGSTSVGTAGCPLVQLVTSPLNSFRACTIHARTAAC